MAFIRSFCVLIVCVSVGWADHELRTLGNKTVKGKVLAITDQQVQMKDLDGKEVQMPLSQVLAINLRPVGTLPKNAEYTLVNLFESQLYCKEVQFKGKTVEVTLLSGQKAAIPLSNIVGVLREAQKENLRKEWNALNEKVVKTDRVLVVKDGVLNALEGTLGDVDPKGETIQFRLESGTIIPAKLAKLQGMIFYRHTAPAQSPSCIVYDVMGNKLAAKDVSVKDDDFLITTPSGATITFAERALAKLDYNRGKLTFLSDMEPVEVIHKSGIGLEIGLQYRKDTNLEGEPIVLSDGEHSRGLSMHAHTELEYDLGGNYKDFKAVLGVDAAAKTESKAIVTIYCDGLKAFEEKVNPTKVVQVALNVRNVRRLRIVVSSEDILNLHDRATLAEARVNQ